MLEGSVGPVLRVVAATIVALLVGGTAMADVGPTEVAQQEPRVIDVNALPGTTIAQGFNQQPTGVFSVKSYRVEEITFPAPTRATVNGQEVTVDRAIRLVITGGPFVVRDLPAAIWVDDTVVGYGQENADLSEISVVLFDTSLVHDGASLSVSYLADADRSLLPERLTGLRHS